tara:strand:- start:137 stop:319 length:183 start_codon:yes stop_codon:yes gene_type:complete
MLRKTNASDFENTENLNGISQKKRCCTFKYFILPITHGLCMGLGIYLGIRINDYLDDGSL